MNYLGTISLLLVVGAAAWWLLQLVQAPSVVEDDTSSQSYSDVLDDARRAADTLSGGGVEVYDGISISRTATELDLSARGLEGSLKAEVRQLSQLTVLDLSDNNFTGLPAEVGQLTKLRQLNLANNPFTGLPHELGNLEQLETLDVRGTNFSEFDMAVIEAALPAGVIINK